MTTCRLPRQRKQSKTINQSRKVLDPWFMMKMIIGTFVPSISPHVTNCASLNISSIESSPELRNSCSNVSTIRTSVLLRIVNNTSSMFGDVCSTGAALRRGHHLYLHHWMFCIRSLAWRNNFVVVNPRKWNLFFLTSAWLIRNIMSTMHHTKLQINGPSGHCSHLDFHPPPEVQQPSPVR